MSAQSLQVVTLDLPNPAYDPDAAEDYHRINSNMSFTYLTTFNLRTLSTNGATPGDDVSGLLYTPDLPTNSACVAASAPYVPANATRRANLPSTDYDLVAIAPWLSSACVQQYLDSAYGDPVRGFLWFLPNDTTEDQPPPPTSPVWQLPDDSGWKNQNDYPMYAIPGISARILMNASDAYSKNMTDVPDGHVLTEYFDSRDYVRLFVDIDTAGSTTSLPSLWIFLLVVLAILLLVIGVTSLSMHWLQRRRRQTLRRRVASGEVDLEALGIKRLTVPQEILDRMPLYIYGSGAPASLRNSSVDDRDVTANADKLDSIDSSRPSSPQHLNPGQNSTLLRSTSFHPTPLQQPTCAICLDDFVPAAVDPNGSGQVTGGTVVRELPCHHIFHPECVDTFLRDSSSLCPMCKKTALPTGYCPRVVTNAMVRRERMVRRIRERITVDDAPDISATANTPTDADDVPLTLGRRIRVGTFASLSQLRSLVPERGGSHARNQRISIASPLPTPSDTAMTELHVPASALVRSTPTGTPARRQHVTPPPAAAVQPPNSASRREWARQRAVAMLGRRTAPVDPDAEESRTTPAWRKAVRGLFPGFRD